MLLIYVFALHICKPAKSYTCNFQGYEKTQLYSAKSLKEKNFGFLWGFQIATPIWKQFLWSKIS